MSKPLVIMVGADKGGVGKTTVSRALDDYLHHRKAVRAVFDGEYPNGDLRQFSDVAEVVDLTSIDDQMKMFDQLQGVTLIDIKAGLFTETLSALQRTGLLDDVRGGGFNLALLHVLGPSAASLAEIAEITTKLGSGALHLLVKNYINEAGFKEWEADARFKAALSGSPALTIPHLQARASTEVQRRGMSFGTFAADPSQSRMLAGYVKAWLNETFAAFTGAGLLPLIEASKL